MTLNYLHTLTHTHMEYIQKPTQIIEARCCSDKRIQRSKLVYHRQFYVVTPWY